jgi:hypothetical protein
VRRRALAVVCRHGIAPKTRLFPQAMYAVSLEEEQSCKHDLTKRCLVLKT